ncbi:MAG: hypothetical protein ACD_63C00138G0004 [uncultured bacterium]|nr:MAG: hypothetical protein ACD_63C00138G0004 [uncultured bacterium]
MWYRDITKISAVADSGNKKISDSRALKKGLKIDFIKQPSLELEPSL